VAFAGLMALTLTASALRIGRVPWSAQRLDQLVVPAVDHGTRSVDEWLARFRAGGPEAREALWCLYYADERFPRVIDALRDGLGGDLRCDVDAVLTDWEIPHDPLSPAHFGVSGGESFEARLGMSSASFDVRPWLLDLPEEELLAALDSGARPRRARAALSLVARHREVERALRALVEWLGESRVTWRTSLWAREGETELDGEDALGILGFAWAWRFAGEEAERVLAELLLDASVDLELRRFVLERLVPRSTYDRRPAREPRLRAALLDLTAGGPLADGARAELATLVGAAPAGRVRPFDEAHLHRRSLGLVAPEDDELRARLVAEWIEAEGPAPSIDSELELLGRLTFSVLGAPQTLEVARPWLEARLERPGRVGEEALRALCHAGESGSRVRAAYVAHVEFLQPDRDEVDPPRKLRERVPCLRQHDDRTAEALAALVRRCESPMELLPAMEAAGWITDPAPPLAFEFFVAQAAVTDPEALWGALDFRGYAGPCELLVTDSAWTRVATLGIRARGELRRGRDARAEAAELWTILERGNPKTGGSPNDFHMRAMRLVCELDLDPERFTDYALGLLMSESESYLSYPRTTAVRLLAGMDLDRRQQGLLCRMRTGPLPVDGWQELLASQGRASVERAVDLRRDLYAGRPRALQALLRVTKPSALDRRYLLDQLEHGTAVQRREALEMVRNFELDAPEIAAGVRARRADGDPRVRELAADLCRRREW